MRSRAELADVTDPIEIAATWGDLFFAGEVDGLDWLTMRTCTVDLSGSASEAEPLDRAGLCAYSRSLEGAFEDVAWRVGRVEQREHEVRLDASLEAHHTGPLDLSAFDGPVYPASGRLLRLPLQRLCWTIAHKRVLAFEVEHGPGLGLDLLARELELEPAAVPARRKREAHGTASNGDPAHPEAGEATPRIHVDLLPKEPE